MQNVELAVLDNLNKWFLENAFILFIISVIMIPILLIWVGWVAEHRPKANVTSKERYIDDTSFRKIEKFEGTLDWGTCLFLFRKVKLYDISSSASFLILHTPAGGIEKPLPAYDFIEKILKNGMKRLQIKTKKSLDRVTLVTEIPLERQSYSNYIKHEIKDGILRVWNESTEDIRNYKLLLSKPTKLNGIEVIKGSIVSIEMDFPFNRFKNVSLKKVGTIETDVAITLVLDLPAKTLDGKEQVVIILKD